MTTTLSSSLSSMRINYESFELLENTVHNNPIEQFLRWFNDALNANNVPEANAMTLCTVGYDDKTGIARPSSRIVLLKHINDQGFTWFTNYHSRKGLELTHNRYACLQFHWIGLERQVRIEGYVERLSDNENNDYFYSRPIGSQMGAIVSPQSQSIADRNDLDSALTLLEQTVKEQKIDLKRPEHWGGYRLIPNMIEFWQGRSNRLHDRLVYLKNNDNTDWIMNRLAP